MGRPERSGLMGFLVCGVAAAAMVCAGAALGADAGEDSAAKAVAEAAAKAQADAMAKAQADAAVKGAGRADAVAKPVELRIDYLPNLIYDGENLVLCGAVVNRGATAVSGSVYASIEAGTAEGCAAVTQDVAVPAGKEARFDAQWVISELKERTTLTVTLSVGEGAVDTVKVIVHPTAAGLPELRLVNDALADADGTRLVLVVRRQIRERESRWALVKWAHGAMSGGKIGASPALFLGDLLATDEAGSYVTLLKENRRLSKFAFLTVRHPVEPKEAGSAVLQTLCQFSKTALKREYKLGMIFLGSEEARFGTDIEEFRKAIDLMSGQLKANGCEQVVFVCPVSPNRLAGGIERYRRVILSVAYAGGAVTLDPQPAAGQAAWGSGRLPGPDARKALADEIIHFVSEATEE